MAKKQTRRSISVSRVTYERLKAFCEANNISMSQFVETRVGDFLGESPATTSVIPSQPRPTIAPPRTPAPAPAPARPETRPSSPALPMTSAAARFAVEPPPPVIKRRDVDEPAPKPAEKRPEQIFTF
ncbi:MAG TPA: hypothetical protein VLX92_03985 [Kofleriaceae bacterium]|nr:hypothetical protein [Kofleriaceae bacterium]